MCVCVLVFIYFICLYIYLYLFIFEFINIFIHSLIYLFNNDIAFYMKYLHVLETMQRI